ncbi:putative non-specific serine/threonine protein kinase [Helianthus debilis subsp. tardiflorus]
MKLGWDSRTGLNWELTSWLSDKFPNLGAFTMSFEANGTNSQRLMIRRRGQPYWSKLVKELDSVSRYCNLSYGYNNEERYFSYADRCVGNGYTSLWLLNTNGQVEEGTQADRCYLWRFEFCYGYNLGDGCAADSDMRLCWSRDDKFTLLTGEFNTGVDVFRPDDNSSLSFSDCMVGCLNSCDCLAFNSHENGVGCDTWTGESKFVIDPHVTSAPKYVLVYTIEQYCYASQTLYYSGGLLWLLPVLL